MNFEAMEKRELFAADLGLDLAADGMVGPNTAQHLPAEEVAFYYNKIAFGYAQTTDGRAFGSGGGMEWDNVKNVPWSDHSAGTAEIEFVEVGGGGSEAERDVAAKDDYFIANSFSFGVEREMKESGEKGGTTDMNIGIGELQECTISKSMDWASSRLARPARSH